MIEMFANRALKNHLRDCFRAFLKLSMGDVLYLRLALCVFVVCIPYAARRSFW